MNEERIRIGGAVIFFKMASMSRAAVIADLARNWAQFQPEPRKALACLKSALSTLYPSDSETRRAIRPIEGGYAVISEPSTDGVHAGDSWGKVELTATLDDAESLTVSDYQSASAIRDAMATAADEMSPAAAGRLLSQIIVDGLRGVCLREAGGVYWVRDTSLEQFNQLAKIFERGPDSKVYSLHVAADEQMVRAVGDMLEMSVLDEIGTIEAAIASGDLGKRAIETRQRQIEELARKVETYEAAFSQPLTVLTDACKRAGAAATATTLQNAAASMLSFVDAA